jgi:CHRD domain-containing protein
VKRVVIGSMLVAVAALFVAGVTSAAREDTYAISAKLTAASEVPKQSVRVLTARGLFTGVVKEKGKGGSLTWTLTFSKLSGQATAAHIHLGKKGVAGPVSVPLCGPCTSPNKGSATLTEAQIHAFETGGAYVNVHTAKNPNGEIRGQISVKSG